MNTTGNKFGGRTKGTPNKLTSKIKEKLSCIISEAIDSLDIGSMSERLKLIQLGLPYIVTKPQTEEPMYGTFSVQDGYYEMLYDSGGNQDLSESDIHITYPDDNTINYIYQNVLWTYKISIDD